MSKKVNVTDPVVVVKDASEPFLFKARSPEETQDYNDGFAVGFQRQPNDDSKSEAWQRGWAEAHE